MTIEYEKKRNERLYREIKDLDGMVSDDSILLLEQNESNRKMLDKECNLEGVEHPMEKNIGDDDEVTIVSINIE